MRRRWHKPIPFSRFHGADIPDSPGVYVLLSNATDLSSVLKIAPTRSLLNSFKRERDMPEPGQPTMPTALMYFECVYEAEEARRMLTEYRRNHGRNPILNSPY